MAYSTLKLPPGIRENEPFDGELLGGRNKGFQSRRTYLLGPVIENSGGIRPLVIFPAPQIRQISFEDTTCYCTFVSRDFTHLPVGTCYEPSRLSWDWITEKRKKDARKANRKLLKQRYWQLQAIRNRAETKGFNRLPEIFRQLELYLSKGKIPYRSNERFGILRFSAALDNGTEVYDYRVRVFDRGFQVTVSVPVSLPGTRKGIQKVAERMDRFSRMINITNQSGCSLVLDPEEKKLLCLYRVTCYGEIPWAVVHELPMATRRMTLYRPLAEALILGKISVEEATKILDRNLKMTACASLTAPFSPKKPLRSDDVRRQLRQQLEIYVHSFEDQKDNKERG